MTNATRLGIVALREPIKLDDLGWFSVLDTRVFDITLTLHDSGFVSVYRGGERCLILHPGIILYSVPWSAEHAAQENDAKRR